MKKFWVWYTVCQGGATLFFWVPLPFVYQWFMHLFGHHFTAWAFTPPIGLTIIAILCACKAWTAADTFSIKPLANGRTRIDRAKILDSVIGNKEDSFSGRYAYGGSWEGPYNADGSRWRAFLWNCRNWMANFNYLTWLWDPAKAPVIKKQYTIFGKQRTLQLGWTQLPTSDGWVANVGVRMVGSP